MFHRLNGLFPITAHGGQVARIVGEGESDYSACGFELAGSQGTHGHIAHFNPQDAITIGIQFGLIIA
ncbi:hypothetical protein [Streptomyces sp. NPDC085529]|uniref:hypothetical protein n=1 Tax=Streptomyces sp. NPDC085529 TaxID=3365729 RepID=UPI0037D8F8D0